MDNNRTSAPEPRLNQSCPFLLESAPANFKRVPMHDLDISDEKNAKGRAYVDHSTGEIIWVREYSKKI